jgi:leucyl aminopeptidase
MIDAGAYKVDEVVTAMNGKTIEVTNTDAEGRLVLADCLHYARTQGVTHLVDVATLTGAVIVALGDYFAGLMGGDDEFMAQVTAAGERSGEHVWRLPLHDTLRRLMRSNIADMANAGTAGVAGSIFAARFLQEFAGEGQWAHVDIAGTADLSRSREDEFPASGGTGFGVRLLVELAESLC